ncbi:MAG: hypothetical protein A2Z52_01095 [Candidatus Moranbacteria bacterium RBG_19FT_COMBO_42_6]|nr:MAG: hypothetical protein A2Z52_01095 [Candidatus Moranbacteria bacterium RBG_19FT_COMBO_42_6]
MKKPEGSKKIKRTAYAGISIGEAGFCVAVKNGKKYAKKECVAVSKKDLKQRIYSWLYKFSVAHGAKIVGAGFVGSEKIDDLTSDIWLKQDIVPFVFDIEGGGPEKKSEAAALEVAKRFGFDDIIDIRFDPQRRVRTVRLARLEDFQKISKNGYFSQLQKLAKKFKKQKGKLVFFSSTPRGGGVALMRHALIRLYRLLGVDADWYVMSSRKAVFEVTKKKFHNILQGVASPEIRLNEGDKEQLAEWSEKNARIFAEIFKEADVVVIDDPQPSGLIPHIKKINPDAKIIYRSHIQLRADLIRKKGTPQSEVWNYLWKNIKEADLFVSHPIKDFIPAMVSKRKVVLMSATTDNLDGLNKRLTEKQANYYLDLFDQELLRAGQTKLDRNRPYIIQIARFDPSKGIPDVIESFRKLRKLMYKEGRKAGEMPQLIIAGQGSIDDPEASPVYNSVMNILKMDTFLHYLSDIKVVRLSNQDQILNVLLRRCFVALQLSHSEGFEVKVTEAIEKGKPVIAYRAGGIPLQIEHGVTGFLVKIGSTSQVAQHLHDLLTDRNKYSIMSRNAQKKVNQDYFTVSNASKWLYLATELTEKGSIRGNCRSVRNLMKL